MPCDLVTAVQNIIIAYQGLIASCCDPTGPATILFPTDHTTMCGDGGGLIQEIWLGVTGLLDGDVQSDCATFTADPAEPDPGEPAGQGCLNATYLGDLLDWIDGISCAGPAPGGCNDCNPPLGAAYDITLSGLVQNFATYNGTHRVNFLAPTTLCYWVKYFNPPVSDPRIVLVWQAGLWRIELTELNTPNCGVEWVVGDATGCVDPSDLTFAFSSQSVSTCALATGDNSGSTATVTEV